MGTQLKRIYSAVVILTLLCSLFLTGCGQAESDSSLETTQTAETGYIPREDLQTILFMGLDKYEAPENEMGYLNDQQCDFLMLLILDENSRTIDVLHLIRDTMTEIRRLGIGGGVAGKFTGQLALGHTFGSGGSDSCLNVTKAVSKFLKGVKIDHYIAMTMTGVGKLNDMVGGVDVTIPVDMTSIDPAFQKGQTVHLEGEQALAFVRARASLEDSSNLSRMERQRLYLEQFYPSLLDHIRREEDFTSQSLLALSNDFRSDLTVNRLSEMAGEFADYQLQPFTTIDGEAVKGEEFMEFYADEDALNQVLIALFCQN